MLILYDQMNGNAKPSMSRALLQVLEDRYAGSDMYESQKSIALDATGIAYGGMYTRVPEKLILIFSHPNSGSGYGECSEDWKHTFV